jgi:hypothetical protein
MNVQEGLQEIRRRLVENEANPGSIQTVDAILKRAALPAAASAKANSLLQLTRMLMRTPLANANPVVYNDFVKIEAGLESQAELVRAHRAELQSSRPPCQR